MSERFRREHFEELYKKSEDPWSFATSEYERRKYERTLDALEGRRFPRLAALRHFEEELAPGGSMLAVHWRGEPKTHPLRGDEVHELLGCHTRLAHVLSATEPEYRLDLFRDTRGHARRRATE